MDELPFYTLVLWLAVFTLLLVCCTGLFLSLRRFRLDVSVNWRRTGRRMPRSTKVLMLAAAVAVSAGLLFQISAGETLVIRVVLVLIGACVTYVLIFWSWRQLAQAADVGVAESREWVERAEAVCAELRRTLATEPLKTRACTLLSEQLECNPVYLLLPGGSGFSIAAASTGLPIPDQNPSAGAFPGGSPLCQELSSRTRFRAFVVRHHRPIRWSTLPEADVMEDSATLDVLSAHAVVPLQKGLNLAGFFLLGRRTHGEPFRPAHLRFAETVAAQTLSSLETCERVAEDSARIVEESEARALRRQVSEASFLLAPPEPIDLPGLEFASMPLRGYAGEGAFLDHYPLPNRAAGLVLAEVCGSGTEAIVRLAQLQTLLRSRSLAYHEDLSELISSTRRALAPSLESGVSIPLFYGRLEGAPARLRYINAGFAAPLLIRAAHDAAVVTQLADGGYSLHQGDASFQEGELALTGGDVLAFAGSAVVNAQDASGQRFGKARLAQILQQFASHPARHIAVLVLRALEEFSQSRPAATEPCLIVVRVLDTMGSNPQNQGFSST